MSAASAATVLTLSGLSCRIPEVEGKEAREVAREANERLGFGSSCQDLFLLQRVQPPPVGSSSRANNAYLGLQERLKASDRGTSLWLVPTVLMPAPPCSPAVLLLVLAHVAKDMAAGYYPRGTPSPDPTLRASDAYAQLWRKPYGACVFFPLSADTRFPLHPGALLPKRLLLGVNSKGLHFFSPASSSSSAANAPDRESHGCCWRGSIPAARVASVSVAPDVAGNAVRIGARDRGLQQVFVLKAGSDGDAAGLAAVWQAVEAALAAQRAYADAADGPQQAQASPRSKSDALGAGATQHGRAAMASMSSSMAAACASCGPMAIGMLRLEQEPPAPAMAPAAAASPAVAAGNGGPAAATAAVAAQAQAQAAVEAAARLFALRNPYAAPVPVAAGDMSDDDSPPPGFHDSTPPGVHGVTPPAGKATTAMQATAAAAPLLPPKELIASIAPPPPQAPSSYAVMAAPADAAAAGAASAAGTSRNGPPSRRVYSREFLLSLREACLQPPDLDDKALFLPEAGAPPLRPRGAVDSFLDGDVPPEARRYRTPDQASASPVTARSAPAATAGGSAAGAAAFEHGLSTGDVVEGRVFKILEYGVLVKLQPSGLLALAHSSKLADVRRAKDVDPAALFSVGQPVRAKVLWVDPETGKVSLGLKPSYFNEEGAGKEQGEGLQEAAASSGRAGGRGRHPYDAAAAAAATEGPSAAASAAQGTSSWLQKRRAATGREEPPPGLTAPTGPAPPAGPMQPKSRTKPASPGQEVVASLPPGLQEKWVVRDDWDEQPQQAPLLQAPVPPPRQVPLPPPPRAPPSGIQQDAGNILLNDAERVARDQAAPSPAPPPPMAPATRPVLAVAAADALAHKALGMASMPRLPPKQPRLPPQQQGLPPQQQGLPPQQQQQQPPFQLPPPPQQQQPAPPQQQQGASSRRLGMLVAPPPGLVPVAPPVEQQASQNAQPADQARAVRGNHKYIVEDWE